MTFPESPRVVYSKNPLAEVICQLKFPPILRIESEPPAQFQEKIRRDYPLMTETTFDQPPLPPAIARALGQALPGFIQGRTYSFETPDRDWKIGITREFLALSSTHYSRWEDFRQRLRRALDALMTTYQPSFLVRVGLRYRNVIRKDIAGMKDADWSQLLEPHILGELSDPTLAKAVLHSAHDVIISLGENEGQVRILHGLIKEGEQQESNYAIDSDFFREVTTEVGDAFKYLDSFNEEAGRLFRWCITTLLHDHLGASELH